MSRLGYEGQDCRKVRNGIAGWRRHPQLHELEQAVIESALPT